MIARVADNLTVQASNATTTEVRTDPVALGDHNLARGVLVVHQFNAPGANQAQLDIFPEYSNDGVYWTTGATTLETVDQNVNTGEGILSEQFLPETAYVRFRFQLNPVQAGSDNGVAFVTMDWVVRFSNQ